MAVLSFGPYAHADVANGRVAEAFQRRVQTTPPGMCPIALQLSFLQACGAQTCGKCVPCRDGIPQLARLLDQVVTCHATTETLIQIRALAQSIRDTSDCAIGYQAGQGVLDGLEEFADEYESHLSQRSCLSDIGQTVPCETGCPAHVNVPSYLALAGKGDYAGCINMVRKDNPFPTACGYVCEHPCEERCRRTIIDAPLNIRGIKKFACDQLPADEVPLPQPNVGTGRRIAVVGAGPSGMTCAYFAALMGHSVTLIEARRQLGGMMRYGIPAYRFPREKLDQDIRAILSLDNIEVHTEETVGTEEMRRLAKEYDAVYVAIGAQQGKTLDLAGADAKGVMSAVDLLTRIGDDDYPDFTGKNVVVIGGGNVAMDCARTAVRAGAKTVTVAYRRRLEDMTALRAEVDSAMQEGVEMMTLQAPDSIEVVDEHCVALITQPQRIGAVKRGRPAPVTADKSQVRIPADIILIAVGQAIESAPFEEAGMQADRTYFVADKQLHAAASAPNVFVGGDCQVGPKTVIMAIAAGKVAARNIDAFLGYDHKLDCGVADPAPDANIREAYGRVNIAERPARERKGDFLATEVEMTVEEAQQECARCLRCDHFGCGAMVGGRIQYV